MTGTEKLLLQLLQDVNELKQLARGEALKNQLEEEQASLLDYPLYKVGKMFNRGDKWVQALIDKGSLKARRYPDGELRVSHDELMRFKAELECLPVPTAKKGAVTQNGRTRESREQVLEYQGDSPLMQRVKAIVQNFDPAGA